MALSTARPMPTKSKARRGRPIGVWVIIGVPVLLVLLFVWQLASPLLQSQIAVREPTEIGRVALEPDNAGSRVDVVLVDRSGQDVSANGALSLTLREPDGALWQTSRTLSAGDFAPLTSSGLLAGRLGYAVVVPTTDSARPPRHGGIATLTVTFTPASTGQRLSSVEQAPFP